MARRKRLRNVTIRLLRYTKWKCGPIQRRIIEFLRRRWNWKARIEEIEEATSQRRGKGRYEVSDALIRLEKNHIV
jgi:hypothetical protein